MEGRPRKPATITAASLTAAAHGGGGVRRRGAARTRPVGTEEARSSGGELGSGASHGGGDGRHRRRQLGRVLTRGGTRRHEVGGGCRESGGGTEGTGGAGIVELCSGIHGGCGRERQ